MKKIAIIGLGLIGGSLALALKKAGVKGTEIIGFSRSADTCARARDCGAIDGGAESLASAVSEADLIVIATPVMATKEVLLSISDHLLPGCVVTDAGSTKVQVMQWAGEYLSSKVSFIGGHPMAGRETFGIDAADADLFKGCVWCLTPSPCATPLAVRKLKELVQSIGARPFFIEAETHDDLVAGVSHLPMLLSSAFVTATTTSRSWSEMAKLAAGGYRDFSRLASGNPEMNRDICLSNRERIVEWMDRYIDTLKMYRRLVAGDVEGLSEMLAKAREAREKWLRREK